MSSAATGQVSRSAAEVYDAFFVPALFAQFCGSVLDAAGVGPGDTVLDVGCGTGVLAAAAAERVGDTGAVTGVDINPGMLAVAARARQGVQWRQGDAQHLPFDESSCDAVVSQFALMFVPDPVAALREAARVARPGGRLGVAVWAALDTSPGYVALARLLDEVVGAHAREALAAPFRLGEPTGLRELFARSGLEPRITTHTGLARFASLADWLDTEVRGWTLADSVDDATMRRLHGAAGPHLGTFVQRDGSVSFAVTALVGAATTRAAPPA